MPGNSDRGDGLAFEGGPPKFELLMAIIDFFDRKPFHENIARYLRFNVKNASDCISTEYDVEIYGIEGLLDLETWNILGRAHVVKNGVRARNSIKASIWYDSQRRYGRFRLG